MDIYTFTMFKRAEVSCLYKGMGRIGGYVDDDVLCKFVNTERNG